MPLRVTRPKSISGNDTLATTGARAEIKKESDQSDDRVRTTTQKDCSLRFQASSEKLYELAVPRGCMRELNNKLKKLPKESRNYLRDHLVEDSHDK